ncbi:MAG: iron ABC transporter permease [Betaproteobacteria bacterium]|nr:MAG: iron ABC transporter permease [Betaproteobacteria bacterium]
MRPGKAARGLVLALLIAVVAILTALASGSESIPLDHLWRILTGAAVDVHSDVVLGLRLPRALSAFACGGLLAIAGALMQVLLRNPLADPYVLGLAGGAGTGALAAMLAGLSSAAALGSAWAGALISVVLVLVFGSNSFRTGSAVTEAGEPLRLLLTGVALATGWAALITLMLALAPDARLRGMLFWLMGDLDAADALGLPLLGLAVVLGIAMVLAHELNVLVRGADFARALGVSVERVRLCVLLLASGATAVAVTTAGTVGFVGLIVPNAVRLLAGNDQRVLLPICALAGGALLTAADTLARSALAPLQLPVGAVIAVLGVPVFIGLLAQRRPRP